MEHTLKDELIAQVINSLKQIDVRGFESMNILVGLVMLFENILNSQEIVPEDEKKKEE